jgi:hypothetical protein
MSESQIQLLKEEEEYETDNEYIDPPEFHCLKCSKLLEDFQSGLWCEKCNVLCYACDKCDELCVFIGVIGYDQYFANTNMIVKEYGPLDPNKYLGCYLRLDTPAGETPMNYYVNNDENQIYPDITNLDYLDDCCAYKWCCESCGKIWWTNPD